MKTLNAIEWYKHHFNNIELNKKNSKSLLGFLLIWSAFENIYFTEEYRLNPTKLVELSNIATRELGSQYLLKYIHHFHERYFTDGDMSSELFDALNLDNHNYELVKEVIKNCSPRASFLSALFLIAYRFRNNFIHGAKNPIKIQLYEREFNVLNCLLTEFIDLTHCNDNINKNRINHLT